MTWWRRVEPHRLFVHTLIALAGLATLVIPPADDSFAAHVRPAWFVQVWGAALFAAGPAAIFAELAGPRLAVLARMALERGALWTENAALLWALATAAMLGFARFFGFAWLLALVGYNVWRDLQIASGLRRSRKQSPPEE